MWKCIGICMILIVGSLGGAKAFEVPAVTDWVTDQADIFTDEQETTLEQNLQDLEQLHGAQVAVVTLASLEGQVIEEVALQIAQTRGVGNAEVDNGVVVLIAPNERQRRIEIGYGLEGFIPDIIAAQLGRNILVPAFRQGDYAGGVSSLIDAFSGLVAGSYDMSQLQETSSPSSSLLEDLFVGGIMVIFLSFFGGSFARGILESDKKKPKPTDRKKLQVAGWGSTATTFLGALMVGAWGLVYIIPAFIIWRMILTSQHFRVGGGSTGSGFGGWSSGGGFSSGGSSFGGFGGGSFGGGGAGGRR